MATISLEPGFVFNQVQFEDTEDQKAQRLLSVKQSPPPLGPLSHFVGTFAGKGFNSIFRPNSGPPTTTTFPKPVTPAPPTPPSENVLELNLTKETLTFSSSLGSVPNRGLESQNDIFLNGVPYVQSIQDLTNLSTGKADGTATGIHFEPGLWMNIPATKTDPNLGDTLCRMASIPHGTTINAQGLEPTTTISGPPTIAPVDMTPFVIGSNPPSLIKFAAQTATNNDTPRLPQDLTKFIATGTITQAILDDPNTILRAALKGQTITQTIVISISTTPSSPEFGGGTANIAFLEGNNTASTANANATLMSAVFWIETVKHILEVPVWKPGQPALKLVTPTTDPTQTGVVFEGTPPHAITTPTKITVTSTQLQYSQKVILNFAGLSWPHISVATLVPSAPVPIPASAWK